jgi:hypothetical protein
MNFLQIREQYIVCFVSFWAKDAAVPSRVVLVVGWEIRMTCLHAINFEVTLLQAQISMNTPEGPHSLGKALRYLASCASAQR